MKQAYIDIQILIWNCDLLYLVPKISPLQIVRVLKQQFTIQMWRRYASELKKQYWKENTFWTDGYFCSTIGEVSSETLKHYIQNQG